MMPPLALSFRLWPTYAGAVAAALLVAQGPASAQIMMREADIAGLRLGQKVLVDDGTCPSGQIKQITGTKLVEAGVQRTAQCVDRKTAKR